MVNGKERKNSFAIWEMYVKWLSLKKLAVPSVVGYCLGFRDCRRGSNPVSKYVVLTLKCRLSLYAANKSKVVKVFELVEEAELINVVEEVEAITGSCSWSSMVKS